MCANLHNDNYGAHLHWAALGNNTSSPDLPLAVERTEEVINNLNHYTNTALFEAVKEKSSRKPLEP